MNFKKTPFQKQLLVTLLLCASFGFSQQNEPALPKSKLKETIACTKNHKHRNTKNTYLNKTAACPSSLSAWASYSGNSLVTQLKGATDYDTCLRSFFSYDSYYGPIVFTNTNIEAVAREMYNISISHDGTLSSGMLGLVTYLHAATYHEFSHPEISLNTNSKYWYGLAAESFSNNANLWNVTSDALAILDEYLIMCDYEGLRHKSKILSTVKTAMRKLTIEDNWKAIANDNQMLLKYTTAYNRIFFLMFRGIQPVDINFESAVNTDSNFLSLLYSLTTDSELQNVNDLELIINNAVGELTRMSTSTVLRPKVEPYIAQVANNYNRLTPNWYRAIDAINKGNNCATYNLCEDMTVTRAEVENILFPNTWTFDDGKLKVRTPLDYNTVQELYYASKQVQSQMFRFLETDNPVANDTNVNLNMIVYGTLADYGKWQTLLYNLPSNNGGMYIERGATFYTYQRTAQESTFTLEELFRHEYVHYLQGRYIVPGYWAEDPFYKNDRLVWFEEGMAEHFAGSTDTEGVRIRESQGNTIKNEGTSQYMTVSQVLNADYNNGFKFYRYGNMLWSYWFKNDMATAKQLIDYVRSSDITGFDTKINQLKSSSTLQTNYTNYLNNEVIIPTNWWSVYTPWQTDDLFTIGNISDIQTQFNAITGKNGTVTLGASSLIRRFKITGSFNGGNFDSQLNTMITKLKADTVINNFDYINGYYTNVSGSSSTFVITGSLRSASVGDTPVAKFSSDLTATITGGTVKFNNESTGYLKSYNWSFPGGTPNTSTLANPTVTYTTAGEHTVTLTAIGDNGATNTNTKNKFIKVYDKSNITYCTASVDIDYTSITRVQLGSLDNYSTAFPLNGYSDFTSYTCEVNPNQTYPITIEPEHSWPATNIKVWIDWNQNGSFTDPGENVFTSIGEISSGSITIPSSAITGVTRMRVRYAYDKVPVACGVDSYMGEVEDYSIVVVGGSTNPDVEAPVAPSNLVATNTTETTTTLNWNAATDNVAVTGYDIYINGNLETTVASNNYTVANLTPATNYQFYIKAKDSAGNISKSSNIINITTDDKTQPINYCSSTANNQTYEWVSGVQLENINNTSSASQYTDFTNQIANLTSGKSSTILLTPGFQSTAYTEYWSVWIDYNKNGNFDDAGEQVFIGNGKSVVTGSFLIPSNISVQTRMRVSMSYNSTPISSCATISSGEVEDYNVNIQGNIIIDKEAPSSPTNLNASATSKTQTLLTWSESTDNIGVTSYDIYKNGIFETSVGTTSHNIIGLLENTTYSFYIKAKDANNNESTSSNVINVTTKGNINPINYCQSSSNSQVYEWIKTVRLRNYVNNSSESAYSDFTSEMINTNSNNNLYIELTPGFRPNEPYTEYWSVWIDFNKNGSFDDVGEQVFTANGSSVVNGYINIPSNVNGQTRMRVSMNYGNTPNSCGSISSGEVEDYTITITGTLAKNVKPIETRDFNLSVYPVPAKDNIYLKIPSNLKVLDVKVLNQLQTVIIQKTKVNHINISNLSSGVYYLIITTDNGTLSKKFIKI